MHISEQPGRYLALFIICPLLLLSGIIFLLYPNTSISRVLAIILIILAFIFFGYELFWVINYPAKKVNV